MLSPFAGLGPFSRPRFVASGGGFAPTDIAGNLLWQDPDQEVGADGSAIATAPDYSGTSNTGTRNTGSGITLKYSAINGRKSYVFNDAGFTLANTNDLTEWTYAAVVKITTSGLKLLVGADGSSFIDTQSGSINFNSSGSIGRVEYSGAWYSIVITCTGGTELNLYINGAKSATPKTISSRTQKFNNVGGFSPYGFQGEMASVALWDHVLTSDELAGYHAWVYQNFALLPHNLVICVGDSLTAGTGGTPYPTQLESDLAANEWDIVNVGVAGRTVAGMISAFTTDVTPYTNALRPQQVGLLWGGTNDIDNGDSAATAEGRIDSWCALARAQSMSILLGTVIARDTFDAGDVTTQGLVNTYIRGSADSDGVADFQADSHFDDQADTSDGTYYNGDGIHLTTTGYGVVKGIALTAINAL